MTIQGLLLTTGTDFAIDVRRCPYIWLYQSTKIRKIYEKLHDNSIATSSGNKPDGSI
jgi:hypothetical protein